MAKTAVDNKYIESVGRRKSSTARVRLTKGGDAKIVVNGLSSDEYFKTDTQRFAVRHPLETVGVAGEYSISVKVIGGGLSSQAQAIRHGVSRSLVKINEDFRGALKKAGYLKRDPRSKERRKFGLKKARKAAQWSKR